MSITKMSIEKNRITFVVLIILLFAGIKAYQNLPQSEDPGFIIRIATVITILPGASPERVENLITDPIESVVQQIPELRYVTSESQTGISIVYVEIQEQYFDMRRIWDNLRRKVETTRADLPEDVIGPIVNDEFGDVFGTVITLTGEGYNYAELKEVADQVRDELLRVDDVAKVEIWGEQEEQIFIEYDNTRLAQLGLSPQILQQILATRNIIFPGGNISTGVERIALEPSGNFETLEDVRKTVIALPGRSDVFYLEDIADIRRGYVDPPNAILHASGIPALGIAISMRENGNIVTMGHEIQQVISGLQNVYPIGIEFDYAYFQPRIVEESVDNFVVNLLQAVAIVMIVMLIFLGIRTGLVVATLIPMTILLTFVMMGMFDITMNTISLAALIIALGMLVDNAIVMSESILVLMRSGQNAIDAAVESAKELRVPLLTSSLTTAAAFLPIALAENATGEYCIDLFKVVTIALMCSWVLSLTMVPLFCVMFVKIKKIQEKQDFNTAFYKVYRALLLFGLKRRWITLGIVFLIFMAVMQLGNFIPNIFFPATTKPFLRAQLNFPVGSPIERTEAMVEDLEVFLHDSLQVNSEREAGLINWAAFIGTGPPRYTLSATTEPEKEEHAYLMMNYTSRADADLALPRIESFLWERYPDLDAIIMPLDYGPPVSTPVQVRISGDDLDQLFTLADRVKEMMAEIPGTRNIQDNWGRWTKKLVVDIDQPLARRAGVSNMDIAISLQTILSGIEITEFREDEDVIPVMMRAEEADRLDLGRLETLDVFAQATGATVPLNQVADLRVEWEPSKILRRDRLKTVTVGCYNARDVTAMQIYEQLMPILDEESQTWPVGYFHEYGGELESSQQSQAAIMVKMPIALGIIILLLVSQFNSIRRPLIICITIPLALIGVFIGLFLLRGELGFMTFLGIISLVGIVINNAIVLLDRIRIEQEEHGFAPQQAIVNAAHMRMRPILLTTATTIGGLLPLYFGGGPMWESLSIAIMFGLAFSTVLTLVVVPVLYSLFFRVGFKQYKYQG